MGGFKMGLALVVAGFGLACTDGSTADAGSGGNQQPADAGTADAAVVCPALQHARADGGCTSQLIWAQGPALPAQALRDHHAAYSFGAEGGAGFVAISGGMRMADGGMEGLVDTWVAPVEADGSLGAWVVSEHDMPGNLAGPAVAQWNGRVYLMGGIDDGALTRNVYSAPLGDDGVVGPWRAERSMAGQARYHQSGFAWDGQVCLSGGFNGQTVFDDVQCSIVLGDGVLSAFTPRGTLAGGLTHHAMVVAGRHVFAVGGFDDSGAGVRNVRHAVLPEDASDLVFDVAGQLPARRRTHAATWVAGVLWVVNGEDGDGFGLGGGVTTPWRATLDDQGNLGAFERSGDESVVRRHAHQAPAWNNRIYAVGGSTEDHMIMEAAVQVATPQ